MCKNKTKVFLTFLALSLLFVLSACSSTSKSSSDSNSSNKDASYKHVSPEKAQELIEDGGCTIVDVRTEIPFNLGHIKGAKNIPVDDILDAEKNNKQIKELPDKHAKIIVHCQYGGDSKEAAAALVKMGYSSIIEFDGIDYWKGQLINSDGVYVDKEGNPVN